MASKPPKDTEHIQPTTGCPQARFDLPGFNLPLNWTPHEKYKTRKFDGTTIEFPPQGDGKVLFPTALDHARLRDGACA